MAGLRGFWSRCWYSFEARARFPQTPFELPRLSPALVCVGCPFRALSQLYCLHSLLWALRSWPLEGLAGGWEGGGVSRAL